MALSRTLSGVPIAVSISGRTASARSRSPSDAATTAQCAVRMKR